MIRRPPRSTPLSLHDALPISLTPGGVKLRLRAAIPDHGQPLRRPVRERSEEHTSELQSQSNLVCRLLLEKKKKKNKITPYNNKRLIAQATSSARCRFSTHSYT